MLHSWTPSASALERALAPFYRLDWRLLRQLTLDHPSYDPGLTLAWEDLGFVLARGDDQRVWIDVLAVVPEARGQGVGRALLEAVLERAAGRGVCLGGGPAHLAPGLPEELGASQGFFERFGFRPQAPALDLKLSASESIPEAPPSPMSFGPCPTERSDELTAFVEREFPGRWARDTRRRLERESPEDVVVGLWKGEIAAFCHTWREANALLGPSLHWREGLLRPGGMGPVGVAAAARGLGAGLALVQASLAHLRRKGAGDIIVDWTNLVDFYGRAGFVAWKRYTPMLLP